MPKAEITYLGPGPTYHMYGHRFLCNKTREVTDERVIFRCGNMNMFSVTVLAEPKKARKIRRVVSESPAPLKKKKTKKKASRKSS